MKRYYLNCCHIWYFPKKGNCQRTTGSLNIPTSLFITGTGIPQWNQESTL